MRKDWILIAGIVLAGIAALKRSAIAKETEIPENGKTEIPTTPTLELSEREYAVMRFQELVSRYALINNIEPAAIASVIMQESEGNPNALRYETNGTTAYGLMQMTDRTARALGFKGNFSGLYNPETNIALGSMLLKEGYDKYHNIADSFSYYNGGAVNLVRGQWDNAKYVYGVLSFYSRFRQIWRYIYPDYDSIFKVHAEVSNYGVFL